MVRKAHPGFSAFTHRDDMTANVHSTRPDHQDALFGGTEPPETHHGEIILGPGAFGSPDPRTLGHIMHPESHSTAAPVLDPEFHEAQGTDELVNYTDEEILAMSKAELLDLCRENEIPVKSSDSKEVLLNKLGYGEDDEEESDSDEDEDDDGDDS